MTFYRSSSNRDGHVPHVTHFHERETRPRKIPPYPTLRSTFELRVEIEELIYNIFPPSAIGSILAFASKFMNTNEQTFHFTASRTSC